MNLLLIKARTAARKMGVIRLINRMRSHGPYEEHFHQALTQAVSKGDVVWDVGANIGLYTELFCQWVGEDGSVVAFEPGPESFESILQRVPNCAWLQVEKIAFGETDMEGHLVVSSDSTQNHIATGDSQAHGTDMVPVVIRRGDTVLKRLAKTPNVIKVDVEGFEEEVLQGMGDLLALPELRSVLVEVHFAKLEQRGRATAPIRIEKLLKSKRFSTSWVDSSHLVATRPRVS